jgi:hypothetical protein
VDDVCILAISNSYEENVRLLEKALQRAASWASKHAAKFAPDKFELIHFNNPKSTATTNTTNETPPRDTDIWEVPDDPSGHSGMPVTIPGDSIPTILKPTDTAKYLGVWLDKHLNFTIHRKKMLAKGASSLEALRGISGSTWGSSLIAMRKVYQAVIIPQMLWGLSAWYCPAARAMPRGDLDKLTNELTKIQKTCGNPNQWCFPRDSGSSTRHRTIYSSYQITNPTNRRRNNDTNPYWPTMGLPTNGQGSQKTKGAEGRRVVPDRSYRLENAPTTT